MSCLVIKKKMIEVLLNSGLFESPSNEGTATACAGTVRAVENFTDAAKLLYLEHGFHKRKAARVNTSCRLKPALPAVCA